MGKLIDKVLKEWMSVNWKLTVAGPILVLMDRLSGVAEVTLHPLVAKFGLMMFLTGLASFALFLAVTAIYVACQMVAEWADKEAGNVQ